MKVLHTESSVNWGGQEYRILDQMAWLAENGHHTGLAARPGSDIADRAHAANLSVHLVDYTGHYNPFAILHVRSLVKRHGYQIADCHGSRDVMTQAFARDLAPVIRTHHLSQPLKNKLHRRLQWRWGSDAVIATAQCIKDEILAKGLAPNERIHVVGEWADDAFFDISRRREYRTEVRAEFDVPETSALIAVVGMLRGDKAQEHLIRAAAEMKRRARPVTALIVGSVTNTQSDYENELRTLASELGVTGDIRFAGYRNDVARLTQGADILAITSIAVEAQSRAALQAFASLTPVVASRIGGVGELVRAGETGWLVPPGDAIAYADAFCEILDGPEAAASITAGARQLAEASLRIDAKMAETLALYERLVAGKQPKGPAS
ncbi:MAG: glycosyltransferase family 4 protein [Rhodospirillales bacterium]|jgi:glycosyltransferase involved in cell wall biosynthesis|nr:glycosyltransferase family 4 protein [Rhodospirillales bacterium]MDP6644837.1 glycosyltransferase family 4 protein [Rhodospirillales bacterium]MDP6843116.1 glycosyltransferase family 4 protein [Rhodospirillales bacterium]